MYLGEVAASVETEILKWLFRWWRLQTLPPTREAASSTLSDSCTCGRLSLSETNKAEGQIRSRFFCPCLVSVSWFVIVWLVCLWKKNMPFPGEFLPEAFFLCSMSVFLFSCKGKVNHVRNSWEKKVLESCQRREEILNEDLNNAGVEGKRGTGQKPEPRDLNVMIVVPNLCCFFKAAFPPTSESVTSP